MTGQLVDQLLVRAVSTLGHARTARVRAPVGMIGQFIGAFIEAGVLDSATVMARVGALGGLSDVELAAVSGALSVPTAPDVIAEVRRSLEWWCVPGEVYELRAIGVAGSAEQRTITGFYDDHDRLAHDAAGLSGDAVAVYLTLNSVAPDLLSRSPNKTFRPLRGQATSAEHVSRRRWLLLDLDPVRPKGVSATMAEKVAAVLRAFEVWAHLRALGWPDPVLVDSGNGIHLRYLVDVPAVSDVVGGVLDALSDKFTDGAVKVDTAVRDPNRICKLYGTQTCKGLNTAERPHRYSRTLFVPDDISIVSTTLLDATVGATAPPRGASPPPQPPPPSSTVGRTASTFQEAVDRFNAEHPLELPNSGGSCLACGHDGCFGQHPDNPQVWTCFSDNHEADSSACGRKAKGGAVPCWFGDALDLETKLRGLSRADLLRADGHLRANRNIGREQHKANGAKASASGSASGSGKATTANILGDEEEFEIGKGKRPKSSQKNILIALDKLGVVVRYDMFADRELVVGLEGRGPDIDDAAMVRLQLLIDAEFKFLPRKDLLYDVVSDQARQHAFHPVRDYLDALKWDGTPRISSWLADCGGADITDLTRAISRIVLIAAVRRVRTPGCKFDEMLVLESGQGSNKSTALASLAVDDQWFVDDLPLGADTKRLMEMTTGKWLVEAGELRGMSRADVSAVKAYLSRQTDEARMAYGRKRKSIRRQFIVIGTTNETAGYLKDSTGNRRFWPVRVTSFDVDRLRRDRDQLWAEAAHAESAGESIRLDPGYYSVAAVEQDARCADDPFEMLLDEALGDITGKLRITDAWKIVGVEPGDATQEQNGRLGTVMRKLMWERARLRFDGKLDYAYVRGSVEEREQRLELTWQAGRVSISRCSPRSSRSPRCA